MYGRAPKALVNGVVELVETTPLTNEAAAESRERRLAAKTVQWTVFSESRNSYAVHVEHTTPGFCLGEAPYKFFCDITTIP